MTKKDQIIEVLWQDCKVTATFASQLGQEAQQYTKKVKIPDKYQWHWRVFSEEEGYQFPPSRPWYHGIKLKEGVPKQSTVWSTPWLLQKMQPYKTLLRNNWQKGISWNQSPHMHPPSSLSRKRMESYTQSKIIKSWMSTPSKQVPSTPYPQCDCPG